MRRCRRLSFALLLLAASGPALSQTAPAAPTFEVATVKPSAPLDTAKMMADARAGRMPRLGPHVSDAEAEYDYMSLKDLIALAYGVKPYQVSGPEWLATTRFDIVARIPAGASKDDAPKMLQALLIERFKLAAHRDTQEHPVLGLVVGKGGPKLKEAATAPAPLDESAPLKPGEREIDTPNGPARFSQNPDGSTNVNMGAKGVFTQRMDMQTQSMRLETSSITMPGFADMLTSIFQMGGGSARPIVDMTGLKGSYEASVEISLADIMANMQAQGIDMPMPRGPGGQGGPGAPGGNGVSLGEASDPTGGSTVFASVQKLGLKLEPRKADILQVIVEHAEKTPTDN